MGPKKEVKKDFQKRDQNAIDEPLNTDSWRCVVVMAVERSCYDSFVLKEFTEEYANGRRREVGLIDFDTFLLKILSEFARGDLPHKYASLSNFSSVLQEAGECLTKNTDIPVPVLAKVVKALLFYLREESLAKMEKKAGGPPDPIAAMADRPANYGTVDTKKKEPTKKGDNAPKVRPQSTTKQDTRLLKRGEPVKDDQRIDDAPLNGYFNLYVLLTGFYQPEAPLELIKAGVPLHGLLCIDTSASGMRRDPFQPCQKSQKRDSEAKAEQIQNFWDVFLKILWDARASPYFKDTIFQVYIPRSLRCDRKTLRDFIYREICYLMYDLSDLKAQLNDYLRHMKLWDVEEKESEKRGPVVLPENLASECATVPVVLQCMIDSLLGKDPNYRLNLSTDSIDSAGTDPESRDRRTLSLSGKVWYGSCLVQPNWSQILTARGDSELLEVHTKIKELDARYDLDNKNFNFLGVDKALYEKGSIETTCDFQFQSCGENMEDALTTNGAFRSFWKKYEGYLEPPFALDYCLYPLLMTRVFCPYLTVLQPPPTVSSHSLKNSTFELIENIDSQMRKPHFTVTDSSRSILRALPYNLKDTSRDFFSPLEFKIVSPEKLKASSAPQFRVTPHLRIRGAFASEMFSREISRNLFENLRDLLGEWFFANTNGFHFLELLGKARLLEKKAKHWEDYNCVDHTYSVVNDCIFVALHNRMDGQNVHHETFNEILRTDVGLRDFFEYVLEDESGWFAGKDSSRLLTVYDKSSQDQTVPDYADSDFWLVNSIKYREGSKYGRREGRDNERGSERDAKRKSSNGEKQAKGGETCGDAGGQLSLDFEGYNVSDMAVQFSGLKTVYYSNDCNMAVELIERLYGNQDLGIHVTAAGHTLHLYSYVCPEPHILDPFTFHVTYESGIVVAFTRRFIETLEEIEEVVESRTTIKGKKNSSELSTRVVKRQVPKTVRDEEFVYDMAASLPSGLTIRTVRRAVRPCYIRQRYLGNADVSRLENSRLFLPNGNVVRMLVDGTVEILKADTSIVTASLSELSREGDLLRFATFHVVSPEGYACTVAEGESTSSTRFQILQNSDVETGRMFFRRRDGTNYMLQSDGSLCVEFKDGTKISSSVLVREPGTGRGSTEEVTLPAEDGPEDFVFVYTRIVMEHPAYATAIYDTNVNKWTLLLPQDSAITVEPNGQYFVDIDRHTELRAEADAIQMNRYSVGRRLACATTADLSVFETGEGGVYCHMEDVNGKIFIVEANSNCYILDDERVSEDSDTRESSFADVPSQQSEVSEFMASADLQSSPSVQTEKCCKLSRSNKYFILRRDMTGFQLLHDEDVTEALSEKKKGCLVFTETLPGKENRVFVLLKPEETKTCKKWQVATILPSPKYVPNASKKLTSSTYGCPPSWMHPFPKKKTKFNVPDLLTCRVFIETRRTDLSPPVGEIDCNFCELEELEIEHSAVTPEGVEEHLAKLADNDQDVLKEMYAIVAESLINAKKKLKRTNSKSLEHYLSLSRFYVDRQEYHKRCIRFRTVPDYFHHPAGMSWLILNALLDELVLRDLDAEPRAPSLGSRTSPRKSRESSSAFSNEEIEYNLSRSDALSFSELSYRSDVSAHTAPAVLRTGGVCRCKVTSMKDAASSPVVKCYWNDDASLADFQPLPPRVCDFDKSEFQMLGREEPETGPMTLEDLMCLGLI